MTSPAQSSPAMRTQVLKPLRLPPLPPLAGSPLRPRAVLTPRMLLRPFSAAPAWLIPHTPRIASLAFYQSRSFHSTPRVQRDHHFDTLKFVQRLQEEGFSEAQSVALMRALSDVIEERYYLFT